MVRWVQPSLTGLPLFIKPRRKLVKVGKEKFHTGRTRGISAPLGITFLGQRAASGKIARNRKKAG